MIIQFHTPKGIVEVDTENVSNAKLNSLGIKRTDLPEPPRDLVAEIDELKARLNKAGVA